MRKDSRSILVLGLVLVCCAATRAAQSEPAREENRPADDIVVLTVEIGWGVQVDSAQGGNVAREITARLSQGQIVEAVRWPREENGTSSKDSGEDGPRALAGGDWRLGQGSQGRVRARIQAPLRASLVVRGGDQTVSVPLIAILEKQQRTPTKSPLLVTVERLPWDAVVVDLVGESERGIVASGGRARVSVGLNLIWPETTALTARLTGVLRSVRGGEELWRHEQREVVEANAPHPALWVWDVPAPAAEGTYVLEVKATWEPAAYDGTRIGRLIHRRRPPAATSVARRVVLTVMDPKGRGAAVAKAARETEIDALDFTRGRGHRLLASGRAPMMAGRSSWRVPAEALIEPSRRDRLRGWILRTGAEAARLEPADAAGLAWSAVGLKVAHPERPHRLILSIKGGEPSALGVALIEPGGALGKPRLVLDACASGPTLLEDGPPAVFEWLVWPSATEEVLVLVNRGGEGAVRLGSASLVELADLPALDDGGEEPRPARALGIYLTGDRALEPFSALGGRDPVTTAGNLADYLGACGARAVILPEGLADRGGRRGLSGQLTEDSVGADMLEIVERVLDRRGVAYWLELDLGGPQPLPGLPAAESPEAGARGLVRIDGEGRSLPFYHPLNPEVRAAMKARVAQALDTSGRPAAAGVVIRLGGGATLLGTPDTGLDDVTFARFIGETYSGQTAEKIPGAGTTGGDRFTARAHYLAGLGRMPWLTWRSRAIAALYYELAKTARTAAPGALLAVATPGLDDGLAGAEARRIDRAGLAPSQAWRALGLDLQAWPRDDQAPLVLRGLGLSAEPLAHDLAVSPDLDALVADRDGRGILLRVDADSPSLNAAGDAPDHAPSPRGEGLATAQDEAADAQAPTVDPESSRGRAIVLSALPLGEGAAADEPLAHALAVLDSRYVFLDAKAVAGHEERIRRYAAVLRALPAWPAVAPDADDSAVRTFGVVARTLSDDSKTFLEIANDSPFPIRLAGILDGPPTAEVVDLGRRARLSPESAPGGRQLVLDLLPHGVAAVRIGAARTRFVNPTPYPSPAVLTDMHARFNDLSAQLARLNRGSGAIAPVTAAKNIEPTPRGGRQSAQRALLAALQAYREARYADFARLAESHWIREAAVPVARLARTNGPAPSTDNPKTTTPGSSSPLPRNRALR